MKKLGIVILAFGVACVVLTSCLIWAIGTLFSLNSQVSSLESLLSSNPVTISEILDNASVWVNRTVIVQGEMSTLEPAGWGYWETWNYVLASNGAMIGISNDTILYYTNQSVIVVGLVASGRVWGPYSHGNGDPSQLRSLNYHIEAREIVVFA